MIGKILRWLLKRISVVGRTFFKTFNELIWFGAGLWILRTYSDMEINIPVGWIYFFMVALIIYYYLKTNKELRRC